MDLTLPITYNGWTASLATQAGGAPMSGYRVDSVNVSPVDVVGYVEKRALQDGLDANDVFLGGRRVSLVVSAYGSTKGDYWDKVDDLLAAYSPTLAFQADTANLGFLPFDFTQPTTDTASWTSGTIPMRFYLRPAAPPQYTIDRDAVGGVTGKGVSGRFTIQLVARDPRKYNQDTLSTTITSTQSTVSQYRGNYPTFPIITFTMTTTGLSTLRFVVGGNTVSIDASAQSSGSFTLDYAKGTLVKDPDEDMSGLINSATFSEVELGTTLRRLDGTPGVSVSTVTYREAWA